MGDPIRIVGIAVSAVLVLVVLELVRRRALREEYSMIWILGAVALLGLSLKREVLHVAARLLGIDYPPMVLVLALVLLVFVGLLYFSVVTSGLRRQIERLAETVAVLDAEQRDAAAAGGGAAGGDGRAEAPEERTRPV